MCADIDFFAYDSRKYVNVKFDSISKPYLNSIYQNNHPNVEGMQLGDALYVLEKEGYNVEIKSEKGFSYSIELLVKAERLGMKIGEVPAQWEEKGRRRQRNAPRTSGKNSWNC